MLDVTRVFQYDAVLCYIWTKIVFLQLIPFCRRYGEEEALYYCQSLSSIDSTL